MNPPLDPISNQINSVQATLYISKFNGYILATDRQTDRPTDRPTNQTTNQPNQTKPNQTTNELIPMEHSP